MLITAGCSRFSLADAIWLEGRHEGIPLSGGWFGRRAALRSARTQIPAVYGQPRKYERGLFKTCATIRSCGIGPSPTSSTVAVLLLPRGEQAAAVSTSAVAANPAAVALSAETEATQ